jgi:hypothetical protein
MTTMSSLEYAIRGEKPAPEAAEPLSGATDRAAWPTANLGRLSQPRGPASPGTGAAARDRHAAGRDLGLTRVRHDALRRAGRPIVLGGHGRVAARAVQLHVAVRPRPEAPRAPHHRYPTTRGQWRLRRCSPIAAQLRSPGIASRPNPPVKRIDDRPQLHNWKIGGLCISLLGADGFARLFRWRTASVGSINRSQCKAHAPSPVLIIHAPSHTMARPRTTPPDR